MYYLYSGDKYGTCLVLIPNVTIGYVLKSSMPQYEEAKGYIFNPKDLSKLDTTDVEYAIAQYKRETKRIRNIQIINRQFRD